MQAFVKADSGRPAGDDWSVADANAISATHTARMEAATRIMAEHQVRRLPVMNRGKRLVGIVSLGDLATHGSLPKTARALHGISQPGGQHNQSGTAAR